MTESTGAQAGSRAVRLALIGLLVALTIGGGVALGAILATSPAGRTPSPPTPSPSASAPVAVASPTPTAAPTATPEPTPEPTPVTVPAPLTGLPVTPDAARQHVVAVMIDDQHDARPQSGFNKASIVWQAPAEGGIPRYMLLFQDSIPDAVGPIRSSRQYYIEWASEWNAVYVHVGGSPGALATLRSKGRGELVWNADEFRWGGTYLWRIKERRAPHNVYTDGAHLRQLTTAVGAADGSIEPVWTFRDPASAEARPTGASIVLRYPYETITYRYDATTNTYHRWIDASKDPQVDAADGQVVAPSNVVILRMRFGALHDGHPEKHRLDADDVGTGEVIVSTNGRIIHGTWSKAAVDAPTLLFDEAGKPIALTRGQTFVQVIAMSYGYDVTPGTVFGDRLGDR